MRTASFLRKGWMTLVGISLPFACLISCTDKSAPDRGAPITVAEAARQIRCPRGLVRLELSGGIEDDFAASHAEPARIRPARLPNAYLEAISENQSGVMGMLDYDEDGLDALLIDHFAVPRGIVSGSLIIRVKLQSGPENDYVALGNLDENDFRDAYNVRHTFGFQFGVDDKRADAINREQGIYSVPIDRLRPNPRMSFKGNFIAWLNRADRPDDIDLEIGDDAQVDVVKLVLCHSPAIKRGTSFSEFRAKPVASDVSFLSCFADKTQAPCNPFQGDQLCTSPLPVACYKEGKRVVPNLEKSGISPSFAQGGEVKRSNAVPGNSFTTAADVTAFCVNQFGPGWRVLDYHDGAGGGLVTYSAIPPKTRAWVNVRDQRYANCWDRDKLQ